MPVFRKREEYVCMYVCEFPEVVPVRASALLLSKQVGRQIDTLKWLLLYMIYLSIYLYVFVCVAGM